MARNMITESEYELMKILWKAEAPLTLGEIMAELGDKWARNTVGTLLVRLCEKKVVAFEKKGKANLYYPNLKEEDYSKTETKSFLLKLYNGSVSKMIAALYDSQEISQEEIDRLRKIVNKEK